MWIHAWMVIIDAQINVWQALYSIDALKWVLAFLTNLLLKIPSRNYLIEIPRVWLLKLRFQLGAELYIRYKPSTTLLWILRQYHKEYLKSANLINFGQENLTLSASCPLPALISCHQLICCQWFCHVSCSVQLGEAYWYYVLATMK